jgi:hypothetical protein
VLALCPVVTCQREQSHTSPATAVPPPQPYLSSLALVLPITAEQAQAALRMFTCSYAHSGAAAAVVLWCYDARCVSLAGCQDMTVVALRSCKKARVGL